MAALLQQLEIFELRPLVTNLNCKLSTITEYDARKQLLCLVSEENDILLRYTSEGGQEVLKLISWFRRNNRVIHDVCFDPSGTWLLVLCFDNTLHIVPALAVVDKTFMAADQQQLHSSGITYSQQQPYSTTQVTSYIIPFVGPHECPNSKKCPNHTTDPNSKRASGTAAEPAQQPQERELPKELQKVTHNLEKLQIGKNKNETENNAAAVSVDVVHPQANPIESNLSGAAVADVLPPVPEEVEDCEEQPDPKPNPNLEVCSHDVPAHMLVPSTSNSVLPVALPHNQAQDKTGNSHVMNSSFMASNTCPYPLSVVWWQTMDGTHRAVIGYSDGSICFVALSPNCPFVASTAIDSGSVVKLLLCRDNTFESVMLLITSSLKQQFKLLIEQKAIKYIYPGDISPSTTNATRENDWQIVMPIKVANSNSSDPASDSSQLDEDVFVKGDEVPTSIASCTKPTNTQAVRVNVGTNAQLPPPPPYSVAVSRRAETLNSMTNSSLNTMVAVSAGSSSGVRFQQQQLPSLEEYYAGNASAAPNASGGILPAARARLASLRSLGTKKLNAIKMRLSDSRQKLEEYMPENTLGSSFAIMDSPSLTPELLGGNSNGSFYTIQNLRSTYLLSALHSQSNSLSVHNIDINLKPLFLYKIPKNCHDILISSNLLYSIQYVDIKEEEDVIKAKSNTEKENRDTALEKLEKDAEEKVHEGIDLSEDNDKLMQGTSRESSGAGTGTSADAGAVGGASNTSADTSATTSGPPSSNTSLSSTNMVNAVGVISSAMASLRTGDDDKFNAAASLGLFRFENETVLSLYQMATYRNANESSETITKDEKTKAFTYQDIRSPTDYVQFYENAPNVSDEYSLRQMEIMKNEFPKIIYDPCYVVTNKNVYYIQLKKEPFAIFLDAALASEWNQCREFCNTFDLTYEVCIEFAGDYLLRRKKITQALLTYNAARIKPIRTALKLAMFGQTNALMHLCAMALKTTYILKSRHFCNPILKTLLADITYRHSEDVRSILPLLPACYGNEVVNEGASCSDYNYGVDEAISNLQMSPSSQFHLANLLLITLAEKAVNDKNYLSLWNFLCTNTKYHTNMTSIVLCQSGLYTAALILAKTRGVCVDTFLALTSVVGQEFGWYTELNVCLYNLSEELFAETITYLPQVSVDYFAFVQEKIEHIRPCVLQRLEKQLNPFSAILRPIVSHTSSNLNDNNTHLLEFCKSLIETYLAVLIHMETQRSKREHITNALSTFRINYEDNQFAIESARFKPISAGCVHCACVMDGVAYFWGSNGVPCYYSVNKSSDPPEPSHAVKSLELLSQLNLEVHAVKCGRQHTLVLTNNGLYTFGNNNYSQLGIGQHMQMSLQPMLVQTFDGKNVTLLEAGQYHNAAVANGQLYTWGWGVYGQLGHGDTEDVAIPKLVTFFRHKRILQMSLGHAHSLILCATSSGKTTELYVFGSNHFGQLGIGTASSDGNSNTAPDDELHCAGQVKSLVPIRLDVSSAKIRLIHTKFFTNLAVDENGSMYTWGSSPQALRLANQIKRRANAKQKIEEQHRREMTKRLEAILVVPEGGGGCSSSIRCNISDSHNRSHSDAGSVKTTEIITLNSETTTSSTTTTTTTVQVDNDDAEINAVAFNAPTIPNLLNTPEVTTVVQGTETATETACAMVTSTSDAVLSQVSEEVVDSVLMDTDGNAPTVPIIEDELNTGDVTVAVQILDEVVEELKEERKTLQAQSESTSTPTQQPENVLDAKKIDFTQAAKQPTSADVDPCAHMSPHLVDTSEVAGQILQISSGLFHFALISSSCTLYTWGKNLEHQLGTADKERRAVLKPSPIDSIERPMYVDCGADFTLVMTTDYVVKAFGGNSNGQCGRDLGPSIDKMKQRVVCLPTTKRLMRFESQCVEHPVEINLPRPSIRLDTDPVRYLKSIPRFHLQFMQEANIHFDDSDAVDLEVGGERATSSQQYKSSTRGEESSGDNAPITGQDSDDLISSLDENLSNNDEASSLNVSLSAYGAMDVNSGQQMELCFAGTAEEQQQLLPSEEKDTKKQQEEKAAEEEEKREMEREDNQEDDAELQQLRHYIHYCLYVFHGLYNPAKVRDFAPDTRLEYRIRTLMLNFQFVDAFVLCLRACPTARKSLRVFEYFSKDSTGCVPMRRQDLKYLIYYLLLHFLAHKFDMLEAERYFLADLDYYLLELAYVLYFNNNNTVLEHNLNQKFKSLIAQEDNNLQTTITCNQAQQEQAQQQEAEHKLEDTDVIFDSLSVKFKTIVCQRLLKHCSNN